MRARLVETMDAAGLDVVVHPTWGVPPAALGTPPAPATGTPADGNASPLVAPPTGAPSVAVPAGWTAAGLPFSLSFIARPFDDAAAVRAAAAYEVAAGVERRPPPLFHECT
jgi:aspartyl-tRNA(Asn)/glutamyl-tRNA(Gln) amidotransferase subunit A